LSLLESIAVLLAGMAAGAINTVVGSGTLITFPVLLAFGYGPVTANVSNTIGLVPGSVSGAIGYRRELAGQRARALRLSVFSATGGLLGAIALLTLPDSAFEAIVPVLIALALVLVIAGPRLSRAVARRREEGARPDGGPALWLGIFGTGVYGGYFGAAQGVLLTAILGIGLDEDLQRINALKNVLAGLVNAVAAAVFILVADVAWQPAILIAVGSIAGGQLGAKVGRRLSPGTLRAVIIVVGLVAIAQLVL
jgi:uncharacterized membrane protein YfcA